MAPLSCEPRELNELSVRSQLPDMDMAQRVRPRGPDLGRLLTKLIVTIHGFHNSEGKARCSYMEFRKALRAALWIDDETELGSFWGFHWPSDHPRGAISLATYSVRVKTAELAGLKLANYLATMKHRPEVILVAHSLGCRVALETVKYIREMGCNYRGARVRALCLLAAAVPTHLCEREEGTCEGEEGPCEGEEGTGEGEERPFAKTVAGCGEYVFHSTRDRVLQLAFAKGQFAVRERGPAVGLRGAPLHRWHRTVPTGLGHSDYWSDYHVAEHVGRVLGRTGARRLRENKLVEQDGRSEEGELEEGYLPSHQIGGG
jgi:pimeloyl-ACP methyl ester carboxylesterase